MATILLVWLLSVVVLAQAPSPSPTPSPTPVQLSYTVSTLVPAGALFQPEGLVLDAAGNLYLPDAGNNLVRYVNTANGNMTTFAGTLGRTYKDDNPALPASCQQNGDGCGPEWATFGSPRSVAIDPAGNIYISDFWSSTIRRFDAASGKMSTYAGATRAGWLNGALHNPEGMVFDSAGNLYIADRKNNAVRKVAPPAALGASPVMTTIAGLGPDSPGCTGDGGKATAATLTLPQDVAVDSAGNLYIADSGCRKVRIVTPDGNIHTLAGVGGEIPTPGVTIPYDPAPQPALSAVLAKPVGLALDGAGHLFISDPWIDVIWLYDQATQNVYAIAGMGPKSRTLDACAARTNTAGDGCPATQAHINSGYRVAVGRNGVLYVPEHGGGKNPIPPFTVRLLTPVAASTPGGTN